MKQRLLIWFRRFRPEYGQKFRFHTSLAEACSGLAYPVTIQDSSYSSTLLGSFYGRGWFILPVVFIAYIISLLVVALLSLTLFPEKYSLLGFGIGMALFLIVGLFLVFKTYRRLGYKRFSGQDAGLQVISTLEHIKAGRRGNVMGVDVFQCDDAVWQSVVAASLTKADIAIVDISEVTENLAWEISQAFKFLPQDRVIFVCEEQVNQANGKLTALNQIFSGIKPGLDFEKIKDEVVVFPSKWTGVGFRSRRRVVEFAKRLRLEIADRLLQD